MLSLGYFGSRIAAIVLVAVAFGPVCLPQKKHPSNGAWRSAQEEDIREAAFLFLFGIGAGPDPDYPHFCLSVDSKGFNDRHDPSDSLMKRLSQTHRTVRKFSESEIVSKHEEPRGDDDDLFGRFKDRESGKRAWLISLGPITWVNDHKVRVKGERYCGGLCAWGSTLQATLHNGKRKVDIAAGAFVWVS